MTFARDIFFGKMPLFELQAQWKTEGRFFSAGEIFYTSPKTGADIVSVVIVAGRKLWNEKKRAATTGRAIDFLAFL